MHIPDNYLSPSTCAVLGALMLPVWKRASTKVKEELSRKKIPLLGICAAFSFLVMMFNLPLPGGTTGHAVGAALIAILLGPYAAVISVTVALIIQAVFFGDGGILAIGANAFNMAFVMPFVAYYTYRLIKGFKQDAETDYIAAFVSGYVSLNVAALLAAIEFGIQPILFIDANGMPLYCPYPLSVSLPAMLIPHMTIAGFAEGALTALAYAYVKRVSPEIIYEDDKLKTKPLYILIGMMVCLSPLGLLANGTAWGEWGADELKEMIGYIPQAIREGFSFHAPVPDYTIPGLSGAWAYIVSAVLGVIIVWIMFKFINHRIAKAVNK